MWPDVFVICYLLILRFFQHVHIIGMNSHNFTQFQICVDISHICMHSSHICMHSWRFHLYVFVRFGNKLSKTCSLKYPSGMPSRKPSFSFREPSGTRCVLAVVCLLLFLFIRWRRKKWHGGQHSQIRVLSPCPEVIILRRELRTNVAFSGLRQPEGSWGLLSGSSLEVKKTRIQKTPSGIPCGNPRETFREHCETRYCSIDTQYIRSSKTVTSIIQDNNLRNPTLGYFQISYILSSKGSLMQLSWRLELSFCCRSAIG